MQVSVNLDRVKRKLSGDALRLGRYTLVNQALSDMNQFVPKREGDLRTAVSMSTDATEIIYNMPYAQAQFYGGTDIATFSSYTTPGTGPRWDEKAKGIYMDDWEVAFMEGAGW